MQTTIQISGHVKEGLDRKKMFARDTYNDVIERMLEDDLELNEGTKKEIEEAIKRYKAGQYLSHEEVKKELGF